MNLWTAIVAIVAIWGVVQIAQYWIKSSRENNDKDRVRVRNVQIEELESRIQTLETILTDRRESLKRKIDDI